MIHHRSFGDVQAHFYPPGLLSLAVPFPNHAGMTNQAALAIGHDGAAGIVTILGTAASRPDSETTYARRPCSRARINARNIRLACPCRSIQPPGARSEM